MHSKGDNIQIMIYHKVDEVIKEMFESLLSRYQIGAGVGGGGDKKFIFDYIWFIFIFDTYLYFIFDCVNRVIIEMS